MTRLAAFLNVKTSNISSEIYLAKWCITRENFAGLQSKILPWNLVQLWPQKLLLLPKLQCPECGFYLTLYFDIFCWWRPVDKWHSSQQPEAMSTDCYWSRAMKVCNVLHFLLYTFLLKTDRSKTKESVFSSCVLLLSTVRLENIPWQHEWQLLRRY